MESTSRPKRMVCKLIHKNLENDSQQLFASGPEEESVKRLNAFKTRKLVLNLVFSAGPFIGYKEDGLKMATDSK